MPTVKLSHALGAGEFLVADGALATELEARGCDLADPLWSAKVLIEAPHLIKEVHLDYFRARANIATTASYQATPQGFGQRGIGEAEALELVALSVRLADEARRDYHAENPSAGPLLIAGSVGPYGAFLADGSEYRGDYELEKSAFLDFHRPRIAALVGAGVDLLACETLPSLPEAEALLELLDEFDVEAWFSFTLRDGGSISDGTPLGRAARLVADHPRVVAVGVNCVPLGLVTPALGGLRTATRTPLIAYPNSGEAYDPVTKTWGPAKDGASGAAASLAGEAGGWRHLGARIVGGCCRTTPGDIAAIARLYRPRPGA